MGHIWNHNYDKRFSHKTWLNFTFSSNNVFTNCFQHVSTKKFNVAVQRNRNKLAVRLKLNLIGDATCKVWWARGLFHLQLLSRLAEQDVTEYPIHYVRVQSLTGSAQRCEYILIICMYFLTVIAFKTGIGNGRPVSLASIEVFKFLILFTTNI